MKFTLNYRDYMAVLVALYNDHAYFKSYARTEKSKKQRAKYTEIAVQISALSEKIRKQAGKNKILK